MEGKIADLAPARVWAHFRDIILIPRPSGHEKKIAEHLRQFAAEHGLYHKTDAAGNIIIRKDAYSGKEKAKGAILQAHIDMVPQKNSDKTHDFLTDPIKAIVDGEWVRADQTTLGADNGIGMAAILAILESDEIKHGPLEALFTVSEETGMDGAFGLDKNDLTGGILLNLDSEDEGELYIGCAGGIDLNIDWNYKESETLNTTCCKLMLSGLKGGHSGIDINLGRGNANKLMLGILKELAGTIPFGLGSFTGGNLRNAIPRESEACIVIEKNNIEKCKSQIEKILTTLRERFEGIEDNIQLQFMEISQEMKCMDTADRDRFLNILLNCPDGVIAMSESISGIVQTSNNLAIVKAGQGKIEVKTLLRSSDNREKMKTAEKIEGLFRQAGAEVEIGNGYPGWLPDMDSEVLRTAKKTYLQEFGKEPRVKVIHAGLECGIIGGKMPGLDMISFGPTIRFPHSPDEKVHIGSVNRFWIFLKALLEAIS